MLRHTLPIACLLLVLCFPAEANIGIVQIYRASHWMGVVALVLAVLVEGEALGRWLHPGPGGSSVRDRAFWVATAANFACVVLGYVFPSVNSNELSSYLGTQGVMGRHLLAFVGLWVVFSVLVEVPIAVLVLRRHSSSLLRIVSGVIVANVLSSICLAAGVLAFRLWY
jgi:uncharacterized membrane protein YhaH (DUF805 family)